MKNFRILLVVLTASSIASFVAAQTWTQTSAPGTNWTCVACSADGVRLAATTAPGGIYVSTNSGGTWTLCTNAPVTLSVSPFTPYQWSSIAGSADGSQLVATSDSFMPVAAFPGWVYISTNLGGNWTQSSAPGGHMNWISSGAAASGATMIVADSFGGIYTSTDHGANWSSNNAPTVAWTRLAVSADCTRWAGVVYGGAIYTSTDSGATWVTNNVANRNWRCIASSGDGMKLVAAVYGGGVYISTNAGGVWTQTIAPSKNWQAVASSTDGSRLAAGANNGGIYFSTNSGATWIQTGAPTTNWTSIVVSADGSRWVAASSKAGIYTCYVPNAPLLNLASGNNRMTLSWIVPATNLVLQRTTNFTKWSSLTNAPALNLTNLQREMWLIPSNRNEFFRLKTP